ncbi:RNA polymerase sigma-70 factor (family 1) [Pedobacter africanus]|uniref:RNA polymerase sigma-70 factor (ECF subfamily) n=1 Tax=Pedobacter africanus TaxID=151894 RepID=A0ACC6KQF7_9SPHI|nr:RNA polymerase sigma-70 factor [Pedobacter africanus]MDR6781452.1 RNA polymerase sigma-70 factor (ECF subfamily) [Pedobacter africanus]
MMVNSAVLSDTELTALLKEGDLQAFTNIYNRYWPPLFLHVRRMLSDDDQAQDVLQDMFSWLWQHKGELHFSSSLAAYLYTATRNRVFNRIKHEKVKTNRLEDIRLFMQKGNYEADEALRYKELAAIVKSEVEKMPEKMRQIFELSRNQYLSHKEIAEMLNISEHTVRTQVQRALKILRNKLGVSHAVLLTIIAMMD